jgi:hypothetical protein
MWILCILFCTIGRYYNEYYVQSNKKSKDMGEVSFSPTVIKLHQEDPHFYKNMWNLRYEINTYLHKYLVKNLSKGIYSTGIFFFFSTGILYFHSSC